MNTGICNHFHWMDDGKKFTISDIDVFARDVLPLFFKHNRYASFVRQLNHYGSFRQHDDDAMICCC